MSVDTGAIDDLHHQALRGEVLGVPIIDAHAHLMPESTPPTYFPFADEAGMVTAMDRYGIAKACVSVTGSGEGNDLVAKACAAYPDRFIGYHMVNPRYPDRMVQDMEASFATPGFLGLGEVHPTSYHHDYPVTGPNYEPAWEFAEARHLPVLIHAGPTSESTRCRPRDLGAVASQHPRMNVLIGHCGGYDSWDMLEEAIDTTRTHDNVYLEICAMGRFYGVLEYLVSRVGGERVIYGSDGPFHDWSAEIAHVAFAKVPDSVKELIFHKNMQGLLDQVKL